MEPDIDDLLTSTIKCVLSSADLHGYEGIRLHISVRMEDDLLSQVFKAENINLSTYSTDMPENGIHKICKTCEKDYIGMDHHLHLVFFVKDDGEDCLTCLRNKSNHESKQRTRSESEMNKSNHESRHIAGSESEMNKSNRESRHIAGSESKMNKSNQGSMPRTRSESQTKKSSHESRHIAGSESEMNKSNRESRHIAGSESEMNKSNRESRHIAGSESKMNNSNQESRHTAGSESKMNKSNRESRDIAGSESKMNKSNREFRHIAGSESEMNKSNRESRDIAGSESEMNKSNRESRHIAGSESKMNNSNRESRHIAGSESKMNNSNQESRHTAGSESKLNKSNRESRDIAGSESKMNKSNQESRHRIRSESQTIKCPTSASCPKSKRKGKQTNPQVLLHRVNDSTVKSPIITNISTSLPNIHKSDISSKIISPLRRSSRSTKSHFRRPNPLVESMEKNNEWKDDNVVKDRSSHSQVLTVTEQKSISTDYASSEMRSDFEEYVSEYADEEDYDDDYADPDFVLDEKPNNVEDDLDIGDHNNDIRVQREGCSEGVEDTEMAVVEIESSHIPTKMPPQTKILHMESNLGTEDNQKDQSLLKDVTNEEVSKKSSETLVQGQSEQTEHSILSTEKLPNIAVVTSTPATRQPIEHFLCDICKARFSCKRYYARHVQKRGTVPVRCDTCGANFHSHEDVKQHQLTHRGVNPFMCDVCFRSFPTKHQANKHALMHFPPHERPYICEKCGKGFVERHALREHMHIHAEHKPYQCMYCDATYAVRHLLHSHLKCHSSVTYKCYTCDKVYKTFITLKEHLAVYKDHYTKDEQISTEKVPKLSKPSKKTQAKKKSFQEIKRQAELESTKSKPGLISSFNKDCLDLISYENSTSTSPSVQQEEEQYDNQNDVTLQFDSKIITRETKKNIRKKEIQLKHGCKICWRIFTKGKQLTRHYTRYGKVSHPCGKCNAQFHNTAGREQHSLLHDGTHKYQCRICFKSFAFLSACRIHASVHLPRGGRPFACDKCGKAYSTRYLLKYHAWTHDNKMVPKSCDQCGERFRTSQQLNKHMAVHKEKMYRCGSCNQKYKYASSLQDHLLIMNHNSDLQKNLVKNPDSTKQEQKFVCISCDMAFVYSTGLENHIRKLHKDTYMPSDQATELQKFAYDKFVERVKLQKARADSYLEKRKHGHFPCELCERSFKRRDSLRRHKLEKHSTPKLVCSVCGKGFITSLALERHSLKHGDKKPFQCIVCPKAFFSELGLKKHKMHHDDSYLSNFCDVCGKGFQFPSLLKSHMLMHTGEKPFMCEECGKGFISNCIYQKHKLAHGPKTNECTLCGKKFAYQNSLSVHMRSHGECKADFPGEICGKSFRSKDGLNGHVPSHQEKGDAISKSEFSERQGHQRNHDYLRPFSCCKCPMSFKTNYSLVKHMKSHQQQSVLSCDICDVTFSLKSKLKQHMLCHLGVEAKHVSCDKCNEMFRTHADLKKHMKQHLTTFECSQCQKVFNTKAILKCHMKRHDGPQRVKCPRCNIFFKDLAYLNDKHLQVCIDGKYCTLCGCQFQSQQNLQSHMGLHTGERPHECGKCGKAFGTVYKLSCHQKMHLNSFPCSLCKKIFKKRANLKAHTETHMKKKVIAKKRSTFPLIHSLQLVQKYQEEQRRRDTASIALDRSGQQSVDVGAFSIHVDDKACPVHVDAEVQPMIDLDPSCLIHESALPPISSEQVVLTTIEDDYLPMQTDNPIIMVAMAPDRL